MRDLLFRAVFDWEIEEFSASVEPAELRTHTLEEIAEKQAGAIEECYQALLVELRREARDLVERRWPHIEAVAAALLDREALSGEDVRAIIERVERRPNGRVESAATRPAPTQDSARVV